MPLVEEQFADTFVRRLVHLQAPNRGPEQIWRDLTTRITESTAIPACYCHDHVEDSQSQL
jgi:hypothetical protein